MKEHDNRIVDLDTLKEQLFISVNCGRFSYAAIPALYHSVMGVSGTLKDMSTVERDFLKNHFRIETFTYIPSIYVGSHLEFSEDSPKFVVIDKKHRHHIQILNEITERISGRHSSGVKCQRFVTASVLLHVSLWLHFKVGFFHDRAVMVFFESMTKLFEFYKSSDLKRVGMDKKTRIMTEETSSKDKEVLVRQAATAGSITLLTRSFGRGTDFFCYDSSLNDAGGVHVIQTFVSEDLSEETQIKGRTARQGKKGSFSMVLCEEELEMFGLRPNDVQRMQRTHSLYSTIHERRTALFERRFPESLDYMGLIKTDHDKAQSFIENLQENQSIAVKSFLVEHNSIPFSEMIKSRTICLMDATGSMGDLLTKCKATVAKMFERAHRVLGDAGLEEGLFELQFAVYRNYNVTEDYIVQYSSWESEPQNLKTFIDSIQCNGGMGNEAIELGFAHVNDELGKGDVSQVILIGDMPPNTREEVRLNRGCYDEYWRTTKYAVPTYYEDELAKMVAKEVAVHCFYVHPAAEQSFEHIAGQSGGQCSELDIHSSAGAEMLTDIVTE